MTAEQYRDYWLHQAVYHPDLQHTDEQRVFQMISIEEAFGDFRSGAKTKSYILRPIFYTYGVALTESGETRKMAQGGFIVAHYYDARKGSEMMLTALDKAERLNDQLIEKIIADSQAGHPLWHRSLDSRQNFNSQPIMHTADGSYVGYRTVFSFHNFFHACRPAQQVAWADGGLTPQP